jgi:hypothetical protein
MYLRDIIKEDRGKEDFTKLNVTITLCMTLAVDVVLFSKFYTLFVDISNFKFPSIEIPKNIQ